MDTSDASQQKESTSLYQTKYIFITLCFFLVAFRIIYSFFTYHTITLDETQYIIEAKHMLAGIFDPLKVHFNQGGRYVFLLILAFEILLFGFKKYLLTLFLIGASLLTGIFLYFIAKKIYNEQVALLALFLFAIFPLNIRYSTIIETDILASTIIIACIFLFLSLEGRKSYLLIGALLGLSFFIKFFSLLALPLLFFLVCKEKKYSAIGYIFLGFLLVASPFLLYQYQKTGDLLYHFTHDEQVNRKNIQDRGAPEGTFLGYLFLSFSRTQECPLCPAEISLWNMYPYFFLLGLFFLRKAQELLLPLWALLGYLFLELHPQIFPIERYLLIIEGPIIILAAMVLSRGTKKIFFFALFFLSMVSFVQLSATGLFFSVKTYNEEIVESIEDLIFASLKDLPEKDLYVTHYLMVPYLTHNFDYTKNSSLPFGYRGPAKTAIYDLHFVDSYEEIQNAYVFIDHTLIDHNDTKDYFGYYRERNLSHMHLRNQTIPMQWEKIFVITHEEGRQQFSLWSAP